jgi:hypothetical protein
MPAIFPPFVTAREFRHGSGLRFGDCQSQTIKDSDMIDSPSSDGEGPWLYKDPNGLEYVIQLVPMEKDPTLDDSLQPQAIVFQSEAGWIRVSPVGHDFLPTELTGAQILAILRNAAGTDSQPPVERG